MERVETLDRSHKSSAATDTLNLCIRLASDRKTRTATVSSKGHAATGIIIAIPGLDPGILLDVAPQELQIPHGDISQDTIMT